MQLPDFILSDELNSLRMKINAPLIVWESGDVWDSSNELLKALQNTGTVENLSFGSFDVCKDGTLEIAGKKVIVYIKDQYQRNDSQDKGYKFHVANCKTLMEFQNRGKYHGRYVASIKKTNQFTVNVYSAFGQKLLNKDVTKTLQVCMNCLNCLDYKSYNSFSSPGKYKAVGSFDLNEFFSLYKSTLSSSPRHTEETMPLNQYPPNWGKISKELRENYNYTCQQDGCSHKGISYRSTPNFIQVHHRNHLKSDCSEENLLVLCKDCHRKIHPHLI